MAKKIDITTFTSSKNVAAQKLIDIMTEKGDEKLLEKAVNIIIAMNIHLKELFDLKCYNSFYYMLIYNHYRSMIQSDDAYNKEYKSYIANIMHARHKAYFDKVREINTPPEEAYEDDDVDNC